jgi:hypothetical protein
MDEIRLMLPVEMPVCERRPEEPCPKRPCSILTTGRSNAVRCMRKSSLPSIDVKDRKTGCHCGAQRKIAHNRTQRLCSEGTVVRLAVPNDVRTTKAADPTEKQ